MSISRHAIPIAIAAMTIAGMAGPADAAPPAPVYVTKAGAGDLYERTAGQLVADSTRNPALRRFAGMMVTDHTRSTAMVEAAALRAGLHPQPPMLDPTQRYMLDDLTHARGRKRDSIYVEQQKMAHQEALTLHQDYAATGNVPPLRAAAAHIVPVVRHHIAMLDAMPG